MDYFLINISLPNIFFKTFSGHKAIIEIVMLFWACNRINGLKNYIRYHIILNLNDFLKMP